MEVPSDADVQTFQYTPLVVHARNLFSFFLLLLSVPPAPSSRSHAPVCELQNASVCIFKTSPCEPTKRPHALNMWTCCQHTRRRFECTHANRSLYSGQLVAFRTAEDEQLYQVRRPTFKLQMVRKSGYFGESLVPHGAELSYQLSSVVAKQN